MLACDIENPAHPLNLLNSNSPLYAYPSSDCTAILCVLVVVVLAATLLYLVSRR